MTTLRRLKTTPEDIAARFAGSTGVDNSLIRRNGTGRNLQDSAPTIDDDGALYCGVTIKGASPLSYAAIVNINGVDGDCRHLILTGNATLRFPGWKVGQSLLLRLIQDGTGGRTVLWDAAIYWAGGFEPGLTETADHWDIVSLRCIAIVEGVPSFEGYASGYDYGAFPATPPGCCDDLFGGCAGGIDNEEDCNMFGGVWHSDYACDDDLGCVAPIEA